jgi:hypothetical protein
MSATDVVALVYRSKAGCRQYAFVSLEDLEKFCKRKPYCDEVLSVTPVLDGKVMHKGIIHASPAVEFVRASRAGEYFLIGWGV